MIFVVDLNADKNRNIVFRVNAWLADATETVAKWITRNGYKYHSEEITLMGDMIVWVTKEA